MQAATLLRGADRDVARPDNFKIDAEGEWTLDVPPGKEPEPGRPSGRRAALLGAALGTWLGTLTGLLVGVLLPGVPWLPTLLGGLLIGAASGGALGLLIHWTIGRHDAASFLGSRRADQSRSAEAQGGPQAVERTVLPRLGVSYAFTTARGRRVGVVVHRSGQRELISYDPPDHDCVEHTMPLSEIEAWTVAKMLGMTVCLDRVADQARGADMRALRIPIAATPPYGGRRLPTPARVPEPARPS